MKRLLTKNLLFAAAAAMVFASCSSDDDNGAVTPPANDVKPYVIAATVTMSNNSTPVYPK